MGRDLKYVSSVVVDMNFCGQLTWWYCYNNIKYSILNVVTTSFITFSFWIFFVCDKYFLFNKEKGNDKKFKMEYTFAAFATPFVISSFLKFLVPGLDAKKNIWSRFVQKRVPVEQTLLIVAHWIFSRSLGYSCRND